MKPFDWVKGHKAVFGWLLAFIAGGLAGTGHSDLGKDLGMVATLLIGGAHLESDRHHQEK